MRIASVLLVAVLLSTCAISGTFAKYVTKADGSDSARVAKFGVTLSASNDLFGEEYSYGSASPANTEITYSGATKTGSVQVQATGTNVVAPGTTGPKSGAPFTFSIAGTPEVSVNITVAVDSSDIYLKNNTAVNEILTNDLAEDYYPVVFTLKNGTDAILVKGTLAEIEAYLEGITGDYKPNTNLAANLKDNRPDTDPYYANKADGTFSLSWEWVFTTSDAFDEADTLLGNISAGTVTALTNVTDYELDVAFGLVITVTQID